ncbi:MAG: site-specific DNA-methyltransferase [Polyangiaceae bacterium]
MPRAPALSARSTAEKAGSRAPARAQKDSFRSPVAADIPTSPHLVWPGRSWTLGDQAAGGSAPGKTVVVETSAASPPTPPHRLILGDVLDVSAVLHREKIAGSVALVYVDPPYASQADYVHEARLDGRADGRLKRTLAYEDNWSPGAYLDMLAPRLEALVSLLAPNGTIWVQVDWRASHFVRLLLDEIMGASRFLNEIVWRRAPNLGRQAASSQFGRTLDTIIVYGGKKARLTPPTRLEPIDERAIRWDEEKRPTTLAPRGDYTDASIARLEAEGRVHRTASGKVYIKYFLVKDGAGRWCRERRVDALWTDVPPLRHAKLEERTGYPTQKPRALLDRIVAAASQPGDLVVDLFSGSGTTAESAHALGRRAIVGDIAPLAISNARARLLRANAPLSVEACEGRSLAGHADASARITRSESDRLEIKLETPLEPLAWCAGSVTAGRLELTSHGERTMGNSARAVEDTINMAITKSRPIGIRVYEDDGGIAAIQIAQADLPVVGESITVRASASSKAASPKLESKANS